MYLRLLFVLVISLGMQAVAQVDSPQVPMRDQEAIRILNSALAGMTTPSSSPVKDFVISGNLLKWGDKAVNLPIVIKGSGLDSLRVEASFPDGSFVWSKSLTSGTVKTAAVSSAQNLGLHTPYFFVPVLLEAASSSTTSVTYVGLDKRTKVTAHHLRITRSFPVEIDSTGYLSRFTTLEIYVDATTPRVVRIERLSHDSLNASDDAAIPENWEFADYREEAGWILPHLMVQSLATSESIRLSVSNYTFNSGVPDSIFGAQ
jgi:hypothetical protein